VKEKELPCRCDPSVAIDPQGWLLRHGQTDVTVQRVMRDHAFEESNGLEFIISHKNGAQARLIVSEKPERGIEPDHYFALLGYGPVPDMKFLVSLSQVLSNRHI
jgi:hypothetical protein